MNVKNEKKVISEYVDEESDSESDDGEEESAIVPPNGGWGWVVVFSAFYCNVVVDGIQLTFGIFLEAISEEFKASHAEIALAGSLMFGIHLLMGPVCFGCSAVFGLRPVTIAGCLICSFGVGISYFATNNYYLYVSYGVIGGVGLGLVYMNTLMITSLYFTSYLPIAVGIVVCGTGVGTMVFAVLGYSLLEVTSWQNSFLMQSALAGTMTFAAATFKPLKPVKVKISVRKSSAPHSTAHGKKPSTSKKMSVFLKDFKSDSSFEVRERMLKNLWEKVLEERLLQEIRTRKENAACCKCCGKCKWSQRRKKEKVLLLMEVKDGSNRRESFVTRAPRPSLDDVEYESPHEKRRMARGSSQMLSYKRLYLDEEKPTPTTLALLKQTMVQMLDYHLLKSCAFTLFTICGAVQISTLIIVFIFEEDRCRSLGFSEKKTFYFLITLGASNTFWRVFFGFVALFPKTNKAVSTISIVIGGLATICSGFSENTYYQFGFCVVFGMAVASIAVFRVVLLIELVGWELVSNATGINLMFMGMLCIIAPPVLGVVTEATQNYDVIFCTSGSLLLLSGLVQAGIPKIRERELKKQERRRNAT